jgi:transcriptional regulator of acetoin/glycerol metabolism
MGPAHGTLEVGQTLNRVALASCHWSISRADGELGMSRQALHECIRKYDVEKSQ